MAISAGTYTIKSDGSEDYTNLGNAFNDIASGGLTGNLTFRIDGTITDASGFSFNQAGYLNGFILTIEGIEENDGDINNGSAVILGSNASMSNLWTSGTTIVRNLRFITIAPAECGVYLSKWTGGGSPIINQYIYNCCFIRTFYHANNNCSGLHVAYNLKINNSMIQVYNSPSFVIIENSSVDATGKLYGAEFKDNSSSNYASFKNVVIFNSSFKDYYINTTVSRNYCYIYNNASEDNTVNTEPWVVNNNCIGNIVISDEFQSTNSADDDYLFIKNTGSLADGGTTPVYVSADIADVSIPDGYGYYPIGCHCANPYKVIFLPEATGSGKRYDIKNITGETVEVNATHEDASGLIQGNNQHYLGQKESIRATDYKAHTWRIA